MEWNNLIKQLQAANTSLKAAAKQYDMLIKKVQLKARQAQKAGKGAPKRKKRSR